MNFKFLTIGFLVMACLSLAFAEEQRVTIDIADNILFVSPACTREINETILTGYEEIIIQEGYNEQLLDANGSPYDIYHNPIIEQIPIYDNRTYTEKWDCDEKIDYEITAKWEDEEYIKLEIRNLKIQEDYKKDNLEIINNDILNKQLPIRIYDKEEDSFTESGWAMISELDSEHSYEAIIRKEDIIGKEYHIGESSAVYLVTSGTEHNLSNGLVRVTWNTASNEGQLCWYNTTYNCIKLEFVGYSSSTASSGGSYTKSWLEIVSSSDKANISLSAGFYPQIEFTGAGSIQLTGDSDFTADYSYIKGVGMNSTGDNDIDSDSAENGLVLWDESTNIAIAMQPTKVDSGNWRIDFDDNEYEIDYATGETVSLIVFDGIDATTNSNSADGDTQNEWTVTGSAPTDYYAYWDLNEDTGTTADNKEGNASRDGAIEEAGWVTGKEGSALVFNGTTSEVDVGVLNGTWNEISVSMWVKLADGYGTAISSDAMLFGSQGSAPLNYFKFGLAPGTNGKPNFAFYNGSANGGIVSTAEIDTGKWVHLVLIYNITEASFYINASKDGTDTTLLALNIQTDQVYMFGNAGGLADRINATIDEVYVFDRALDEAEITALYGAGPPDTLDNDDSAAFWNVTQTPSFAESWTNATLREVDISRSYDDDDKEYTDTYTYTNITNDFCTLDGTDAVPYFAYALVNSTSITTGMEYFIPSEWGYYPATLNDSLISTITYSISTMPDIIINTPLNDTYISVPELNFTVDGTQSHYNCTYNINDVEVSEINIEDDTDYINSSINYVNGTNTLNITCYEGAPYYHNQTNSTVYTIDFDLQLSISSPANTTYTTTDLTLTYLANSTFPTATTIDCSVSFDGVANNTYADSNNTQRSFDFKQLGEGTYNVSVNCGDGNGNITRTVLYTTSFELQLSISSPTNKTYMDSDLTLTYLANTTYTPASNINCSAYFDASINTTYVSANNTAKSVGFRELNATFHNVSVNCYDGNENLTRAVQYTMDDINFTLTDNQNATAYEGVTNFYNVTIGINPDIVSDINASLYWNDTQIGYTYKGKRDVLTYWFNETFMLPICNTSPASINTHWNATKLYINSSAYTENSATTEQNCTHSWDWDATTYSYDLIERSLNDISVNVSKFGGVNSPVNSTILATLVWNGSPSTMTATMNTSTLLGYSNTTRMPRIPANYNWTFGFNVTLNYSINHGILGYNSRIDSNTTGSPYNYTQTVHVTWIGNCTTTGLPFAQTLNFFMYDEETEGAITENFQAERIDIILADGTSRNYSLAQMTGSTNYSICIYPSWSNYSGVYINAKYAINSSTYDDRRYYLINSTLDNVTNNIGLYNLNGVPITFTVLDETASEVPNAYIDIRRFYASINDYRTIAMAKTGDSGIGATYLDVKLCTGSTETLYSIDIYNNQSTLIKSFPDQSFSDVDCDGVAEETLKITIGEAVYDYWARNEALSYSNITVNDSNNINFTSVVNDSLGIVSTITLNCYRIRNIGNLLISTETVTASSASITCILGNVTGNDYIMQTVVTYPSIGDVTFTETIKSTSGGYDFSGDGVLAAFFLLVALAIGYATTPVLSLIALIVGLIIIYSLGLTLFSLDAIVTLIFSIIFIIYIIGRKR